MGRNDLSRALKSPGHNPAKEEEVNESLHGEHPNRSRSRRVIQKALSWSIKLHPRGFQPCDWVS